MNGSRRIRWLSSRDAESVLTYEAVNRTTEETLRAHGLGLTGLPEESRLEWQQDAWLVAKPGAVRTLSALGIKWLSNFRGNPSLGLSPNFGLIILNDPSTGVPVTVMDGDVISRMRTASVSAVAAKYLGRRGAASLGIVGTGVQGRSHLWAMRALLGIRRLKACDVDESRLREFSSEIRRGLPDVSVSLSTVVETVAEGVDVLVVASTAAAPTVRAGMVGKGCLVIGLTGFRDLDPTLKNSVEKYIVDDRRNATALIRSLMGGIDVEPGEVYAEIGEIVAGKKPGRETDSERILFTPTGLGVVDVAVAKYVYDQAAARGLGTLLEP